MKELYLCPWHGVKENTGSGENEERKQRNQGFQGRNKILHQTVKLETKFRVLFSCIVRYK